MRTVRGRLVARVLTAQLATALPRFAVNSVCRGGVRTDLEDFRRDGECAFVFIDEGDLPVLDAAPIGSGNL